MRQRLALTPGICLLKELRDLRGANPACCHRASPSASDFDVVSEARAIGYKRRSGKLGRLVG